MRRILKPTSRDTSPWLTDAHVSNSFNIFPGGLLHSLPPPWSAHALLASEGITGANRLLVVSAWCQSFPHRPSQSPKLLILLAFLPSLCVALFTCWPQLSCLPWLPQLWWSWLIGSFSAGPGTLWAFFCPAHCSVPSLLTSPRLQSIPHPYPCKS